VILCDFCFPFIDHCVRVVTWLCGNSTVIYGEEDCHCLSLINVMTVGVIILSFHAPLPCTALLARGYVHYWKRRRRKSIVFVNTELILINLLLGWGCSWVKIIFGSKCKLLP